MSRIPIPPSTCNELLTAGSAHARCWLADEGKPCRCNCDMCRGNHPLDQPREDVVNHPKHYTTGKVEVIDYIEDKELGFHLGNAVKYISRAGKKDPQKTIEDLEKAVWYINRHISFLKLGPASTLASEPWPKSEPSRTIGK